MSDLDALRDLATQIRSPEYDEMAAIARTRTRNQRAALSGVLAVLVVVLLVTVANPLGGARNRTLPVGPTPDSTRFAGLPPAGTGVSLPADGTMVLNVRPESGGSWQVYADGRVIWQRWSSQGDPLVTPLGADPQETTYVQQRLTPQAVQLLLSKVRAVGRAAGLFRHSQGYGNAALDADHQAAWYQVCSNNHHLINAQVLNPALLQPNDPAETPTQIRALAQIVALVSDSGNQRPPSAWADRAIRPYVPSHYLMAWERSAPDPLKLPNPARTVLQPLLIGPMDTDAAGTITTDQTRTLLSAFAQSGVKVLSNHAEELDFELPADRIPTTLLDLRPELPSSATGNDHC